MNTSLKIVRTELIHQGKANNVYSTTVPGFLELESSDRVSAGNGAKTGNITHKGMANNQISSAAFKFLEENGIPTHYVSEGNNPASKFVRAAQMIPLEVICRFIATGSFCKRYGVKDGRKFDEPFVEFTFKSDSAGDPPIDRKTIQLLLVFYERLGVTLIDFKVEFGRLPDGQIILCDEISPDTCSLIDRKTGEKLDKDRFRQDLGDVSKGYDTILNRVRAMNG